MSFPHLSEIAADDKFNDGRTRAFIAKGAKVLPVPGLRKLERVYVGTTFLPLFAKRTFQVAKKGKAPVGKESDVQMVMLRNVAPYGACLLRAIYSNNGVWQDGVTIYVTGDWDEDVESGDDGAQRAVYELQSVGDLKELAAQREIKYRSNASHKTMVKKLLHADAEKSD